MKQMFFLEFPCFFYDPMDVGNLIPVFSAFSKSSLYIWKFLVHLLFKPNLKDFEHYLASMWNERNWAAVWTSFGIAFLWDWNEKWPFLVLWPGWVFRGCWHTECSTLTASSFRIWNSSAGILSPLLPLLVVMLPKTHVTLHSRTSGSRRMITPLWLSEPLRSFLCSSSLYSCHFVLISSASGKHCKIKIQKCTNFCCNSFFLVGSNNLKSNYNLKF